ncbi:cytochrome b [Billgrantia pellis]|uniref:Cytochrome b n=1 Tax=Billgrantia pellis TaxID=2606936 RepID=A0A7V7G0C4_9GAMM|nr:cytochrome b [Halomonas pellis]KAA0010388.1 cytochrome b [Halomonas pellis]
MNGSTTHYGRVARYLHWGMAALFAWQFVSAGAHALLPDSALDEFFWPTHKLTGTLLMWLVIVRLAWALRERHRRPRSLNLAATLGHLALYALMIAVPAVALLRQYGSGRAFSPFGLPLMAGFEGEIQWMTSLGSLLHGLLGWTLLALVAGHVAMVFMHRRLGKQDVLVRMVGRRSLS